MTPVFIRLIYSDVKSRNRSHDSIKQDEAAQSSAEFEIEWIRSRKFFYGSIFSEFQRMKNFRKINMNRSTNKMNDEMIADTHENDGRNSEMIVITSKIKELSLKPDEIPSEVALEESTVPFLTNKQLSCIEANDGEVASTSGINEMAYKIEEMDSEAQAKIESKKANITQTIIKSIITSSDSVQKVNQIALRNAKLLLHDIRQKKEIGEKMKSNNLLTEEQSQSLEDEFNSYIRFACDIKDYIYNLIQHVDVIASYVKLSEKKLLSNKDQAVQHLTYFENQLCGHLLSFYEIALACEKAREMFEKTKHEPIATSITPESIEYESMFINHLLNFVALSPTFETAWDASDAYLDILHCLFILLVDVENVPDNSLQGSNLAFFNKFNVKTLHETLMSTNVSQKNVATMPKKSKVQIPEQITSEETTTPIATPENKTKVSPKNKTKGKTNV
ncbi:unnamed protein product [Cercopithifilaria johnstoni]|uniref:Uncharacterized protein n=1 Tax=Cercopithifilaria johnstoni TaxID=2874296 RepID=A0A8J2LYH7_9BILA|nr:unnamed protein product [Cercopithifilaria johnstoni]